jgi:putative thioredoxin
MSAQASPGIVETSAETFEHDVIERSRQAPVVLDFWAPWCQPCRVLGPLLEKLAHEHQGRFVLVKANAEELPDAAASFGVQAIPAVFGLRDGQIVDFFAGVLPEHALRQWIERLLPSPAEQLAAAARSLEAADPQAAAAHYREALQQDPNLAAAQIGLARVLLGLGQTAACREIIEHLAARGYLEPEAEKLKARLELQQQGEAAGGVEACRAAVAAAPNDLQLQLRLTEALAAAGQYEEALQIALRLVQQDRQRFGEPARQLMVDVFRLLPDDSQLAADYRRKLALALY